MRASRGQTHGREPGCTRARERATRLGLQQTLPVESVRMRIARPLSFVIARVRGPWKLPAFDTR